MMKIEFFSKERKERPILRAVLSILLILLVIESLHFGLYKLGIAERNFLFIHANVRVSTHTQLNGE